MTPDSGHHMKITIYSWSMRWTLATLLKGEATDGPSDAVEDFLESYSARHKGPAGWVYDRRTRASLYEGEYSA